MLYRKKCIVCKMSRPETMLEEETGYLEGYTLHSVETWRKHKVQDELNEWITFLLFLFHFLVWVGCVLWKIAWNYIEQRAHSHVYAYIVYCVCIPIWNVAQECTDFIYYLYDCMMFSASWDCLTISWARQWHQQWFWISRHLVCINT